jgi:outer membrane protein TolC
MPHQKAPPPASAPRSQAILRRRSHPGLPHRRPPERTLRAWAAILIAALVGPPGLAAQDVGPKEPAIRSTGADRIAGAVADPGLRLLLDEALQRSPGIAAAAARARAARHQAGQAGALPDPMLSGTAFLAPPETRVGPQRATAALSQRLPWFGKRGLRERAALEEAQGLESELEVRRLQLVTEVRRLHHEIGFLDAYREVLEVDRETLIHYEELARARYASGVGQEQGVVKIQAEITSDEARLLDVASQRAALVAALNALRDRPAELPVPPPLWPPPLPGAAPGLPELRERALGARPELAAADAGIRRADTLIELAQREFNPDLTLGLSYTAVGRRRDPAGVMLPPPDDGSDVLGVSLSFNLPLWRGRLRSGVEAAAARRLHAVELRREAVAGIDGSLGELSERVRLAAERVRLLETVLRIQAEHSLRSAEAGYAAGTLNALDLLDAERVLLEVRTGTERARADRAIAVVRLEGAIGAPLSPAEPGRGEEE